jgi:hypothetical protein
VQSQVEMACDTCKELREFQNSTLEGFSINAQHLVKSAQAGCRFCALLHNGCSWYSGWLGRGDAEKIYFINPKFEHIGAFRATNFDKWGPGESVEFYASLGRFRSRISPCSLSSAVITGSETDFLPKLLRTFKKADGTQEGIKSILSFRRDLTSP